MSDATPEQAAEKKLYGVMAEFDDIPALYHAAQKCRDEGFTAWDVYAPVPVHGMDEAMGLKPSKVSFIMGAGAIIGVSIALLLQAWTSAGPTIRPDWLSQFSGYQLVIGGKPFFAWEQFTPIMFELGVLIAAFAVLGGMFFLNRLPMHHHPLFNKERFLRVSDDRLMIVVEAKDKKFDRDATAAFLESLGGRHIELVEA